MPPGIEAASFFYLSEFDTYVSKLAFAARLARFCGSSQARAPPEDDIYYKGWMIH